MRLNINMSNIFYDNHFIRVVDNALTPELCSQIVELFELDSQRHHVEGDRYVELDIFKKSVNSIRWSPKNALLDRWKELTDQIVPVVNQLTADYRLRWDARGLLPNDYAMEGIRVKCYRPNVHEFRMHVDQANRDSACRFIACLFYLNDNSAGTEYPDLDLTIEAKAGRLVMFPPNWQYPHRGIMPKENTKYIMSTYLHYRD